MVMADSSLFDEVLDGLGLGEFAKGNTQADQYRTERDRYLDRLRKVVAVLNRRADDIPVDLYSELARAARGDK